MPYRDRRERRHERRRNESRERAKDKGKTEEEKKDSREARKDSDRTRAVKHSKTSRHRSRSRDNDSDQEDARAERTDRFKSERFAEDSSVLTTSSRRNDRDLRSDKMGRSRESRRPGGRREQRYDRYTEDYDMNKVAERFSNPTYVPKDGRYFLHDDREMATARRRNMQRSRSPLKWEHDLFQDNESKEQEETVINDYEDDNMKWRSVVQVPMGSTGFGPQYDNFYHQHQRQQDGRWMHDKYFEMEKATAAAATR